MNNWLDRIQHLLLPTDCLLCGDGPTTLPNLCTACAADLPPLGPGCPGCATPLPRPSLCPRCQRRAPPYACVRSPFRYVPPLSELIRTLKFQGQLPAAEALGRLLALHVAAGGVRSPQIIVPVPLHPRRLRVRGFNQALEIARGVGRALELPVMPGAARRVRATPPQSGLASRAQRRRNVRDAFTASPEVHGLHHVAILDDVMTTGATVSELGRVLRRAGVQRVEVWTVARAG